MHGSHMNMTKDTTETIQRRKTGYQDTIPEYAVESKYDF